MGRRARDEAARDLEVLPVEAEAPTTSLRPVWESLSPTRFPAREAFAVLRPPASAWETTGGVPPAGHDELWPTPAQGAAARPWPDCSVRRVLDVSFGAVRAVVDDVLGATAAVGGVVVRGAGRSSSDSDMDSDTAERRIAAGLRVQLCSVPVAVEVVVAPWSRTRTELRLELRGRRRLRIPRRYFDVADDVAERLRLGILAAVRQEPLVADRPPAVAS